ncbi:MAG: hypothetical protein ABL866_16820 [Devosia sp.]
MNIMKFGRIVGAVALTIGLAGCLDMTEDILVTSTTTAKATVTQTMAADIYAMVKAADEGGNSDKPFCKAEGETLTENADKSGTCVTVSEGAFADLKFSDDDTAGKPTFIDNGDGTIKVAIPTKGMMGELGAEQDAETAAMMKQMFDGHFLTIRFGGSEVLDTNMEKTPEGNYAEVKIPFLGLLDGTAKLPEEFYAVVRP